MKTGAIRTVFSPSVDGETIRAFVLFGVLLAAIAGLAGNLAFRELDLRVMTTRIGAAQEEAAAVARAVAALGRDHESIDFHRLRNKRAVIEEIIAERFANRLVLGFVEIRDRYGARLLRMDRDTAPPGDRSLQTVVNRKQYAPPELDKLEEAVIRVPLLTAGLQPAGEVRVGVALGMVQSDLVQLRRTLRWKVMLAGSVGVVVLVVGLFYVIYLIRKNRRLEQSRQSAERRSYVGLLASGLAHEIRNPLNAMNMNLQMLEEEIQLSQGMEREDYGELLDSTKSEIERLERMVNNFLAYARPARTRFEKRNLNQLIQELARFLEADFRQSGVTMELVLQPMLPEAELDETQFKQAVMNLLVNARQILKNGGKVQVRTRPGAAGELVLEIEDNGPGIPPEAKEKIFEVFFSSRGGGTGLGLPIARQIVERHGGTLELDTEPGRGTTFRIRIPRNHSTSSAGDDGGPEE